MTLSITSTELSELLLFIWHLAVAVCIVLVTWGVGRAAAVLALLVYRPEKFTKDQRTKMTSSIRPWIAFFVVIGYSIVRLAIFLDAYTKKKPNTK